MTTIAWDGKTLAADSQAQTTFKSRIRKLYRLSGGALFGAAGLVQEALAVVAWLEGGDKPADLENFEALIITEAGASILGMRLMREPVIDPFYAIGDGAHYALAAMACGKNAVEAVHIAARFDPGTGGRVQSITLRKRGVLPATQNVCGLRASVLDLAPAVYRRISFRFAATRRTAGLQPARAGSSPASRSISSRGRAGLARA